MVLLGDLQTRSSDSAVKAQVVPHLTSALHPDSSLDLQACVVFRLHPSLTFSTDLENSVSFLSFHSAIL